MGHHRHSQGSTAKHPKEAKPLARRHHNFTFELFLDEMGEASEIFIVHGQSGEKENLTGWEPAKLIDFIEGHTGLQAAKSAPEVSTHHRRPVSKTQTTDSFSESYPTSKASADLAGTPHLRDLKVVSVESDTPTYILRNHQPFTVHLTLDLTEMAVSNKVPLIYDATIIARQPGGPNLTAAESHKRTETSRNSTISVASTGLPPGLYRFDAMVNVSVAGAEHERKAGAVAYLEGSDLIEVY
jgi:hypothetical protein